MTQRPLLAVAALAAALGLGLGASAHAETTQAPLKDVHWSFDSPVGMYNQEQLQRGYKVYHEVCSACHSMNLVAFRNLADKGGPFWNPAYPNPNDNPVAKALAAQAQYDTIDSETGQPTKRPGTTADYFPSPFPNETAARAANNGALPPDMSLLAAAREGGARYIYSIVTGDGTTPPAGLQVPDGKYYDPYMPGDLTSFWKGDPNKVPVGGFIAMPPPLVDDRVTFDDGTKATLDQEARDVAAFLAWASDPTADERKQLGVEVMIFLLVFTGLLYASYRSIWRKVGH
ncbi:MAG: cytochrome c1 [Alphaproteobacteria bacterium]|jgi:ubiquinol-cytochrome c reductase cytochrome c1 subunit|nr:cytochrome c1 [Alphaproteobacteria bacterium]